MREELTTTVPERPPKPWGADLMQIAARASWVAPVIALIVGLSMRRIMPAPAPGAGGAWLATRVICGLVMLFGVGSGGVALVGVKRRGPEELVVPAGIGLAISVLVLVVWAVMGWRGGE